MNKKTLILYCTLLILLISSPSLVVAQSPSPSAKTSLPAVTRKAERMETQTTNLKSRVDQEIDRRISSLGKLIERINALKRISSDQKLSLTNQVQAEVTSLTTLKAKIDQDTDVTILRTDVKSIVASYRVYALFMPKIEVLAAADRLSETADKLTDLATKLQARVGTAQSAL